MQTGGLLESPAIAGQIYFNFFYFADWMGLEIGSNLEDWTEKFSILSPPKELEVSKGQGLNCLLANALLYGQIPAADPARVWQWKSILK